MESMITTATDENIATISSREVAEMLLMYKDNFNLEVETKTSEIDVLKIIVKDKNNIIDIYRVYNPTKDEINDISLLLKGGFKKIQAKDWRYGSCGGCV